jgi:hypothetical protein
MDEVKVAVAQKKDLGAICRWEIDERSANTIFAYSIS